MASTPENAAPPVHQTGIGRTLSQIVFRPWDCQIVAAAVRFGLAEKLSERPRPANWFAAEIGGDPATTERFLLACGVIGLVERNAEHDFALTELGAALRAGENTMPNMALMNMSEGMWSRMSRLPETILTGRPVRDANGEDLYDYYAHNPSERGWHAAAMADLSNDAGLALAEQFDFGPYNKVVDIGGSMGVLLSKVLTAASHVSGTVFDLPKIVESAQQAAPAYRLGDRLVFEGGNFFSDDVPKGDLYLIKQVLCDWSDEDAARILANTYRGAPSGSVLAVVEWARPDDPQPNHLDIMSLCLEVVTGGRVRTESEFVALIESVGYRFEAATTVASGISPRPWNVLQAVRP
ncbi:MAG: methyltransferase [Umezawaea sp.]